MYAQDKAAAICARLAEGASLRKAASEAGVAPSSVLEWVKRHEDFAEQYARAREVGYQLLADEIIDISDDGEGDVRVLEDGREIVNTERVARAKLRVDSRKWMLAKMLPKVYGEKTSLEHSGDLNLTVTVKQFGR